MDASTSVLQNASIAQFYARKNILITGATGFMGKVLLETLLRKCDQVNTIYVLIRMKKGVDPLQRYQDFIQDMLFNNLRLKNPECFKKIKLIKGDIIEDKLGINEKDELELIENVNIIFHCAAKAKFSLTLRDALTFNTLGTLWILQLSEKIKNLIVFSHFSTVYCCPQRKVMHEDYTPPSADPYEVIKLLTSTRQADLDEAERSLMKGFPNTYALSKLLAEELVHSYRNKIRFVITRPAVVISAWEEPYKGYVDNKKNGLIGPMMAVASGALRTIHSNPEKLMELIPVDIATHAILALTCKRGLMTGDDVLYVNILDSYTHPYTYRQYFELFLGIIRSYPLRNQLWWPYCLVTGNKFYYNFRRLTYQYLPSILGDIGTFLFGRKRQLIFFQRKIDRGMHTLAFYNNKEYIYKNDNFMNLSSEMSEKDRETFYVDFKRLDMEDVLTNYSLGVRKFILKITDEDSLAYRRGLLTIYWYLDLLLRLIFYAVTIAIVCLVFFFIFDRETFCNYFNDVFNTLKFLFSQNFLLDSNTIDKCNQS